MDDNDKSGEFKRGQSAFRNFISREKGAEFLPKRDAIIYMFPTPAPGVRLESNPKYDAKTYDSASNIDSEKIERIGRDYTIYFCALAYASARLAFCNASR